MILFVEIPADRKVICQFDELDRRKKTLWLFWHIIPLCLLRTKVILCKEKYAFHMHIYVYVDFIHVCGKSNLERQ